MEGQITRSDYTSMVDRHSGNTGGVVDSNGSGHRKPFTLDMVDTRSTNNIKMKQHLCVKHALPRSRLTNTILYENMSQDRHLEMRLKELKKDKFRTAIAMDINKRAFSAKQDRKYRKWRRDDEVRISNMNLPSFPSKGVNSLTEVETDKQKHLIPGRHPSLTPIYHLSKTSAKTDSAGAVRKPILPMMNIRRERTEIISHHDRVFLIKFPPVVEVDQNKLSTHKIYCGHALLDRGMPSRDERFQKLHGALSRAIFSEKTSYPVENVFVKSRLFKYSTTALDPLADKSQARILEASKGCLNAGIKDSLTPRASKDGDMSRSVSFITQYGPRDEDIMESLKSNSLRA